MKRLIIAIGCRVHSKRGTQFGIWATCSRIISTKQLAQW